MLFVRLMEVAFALALASVLLRDERTVLGRILCCRPVVYAGTISYGIYLWHPFLEDELRRSAFWGSAWSNALIVAATTIVVASLSWFGLERQLLRMKDRPRPDRAERERLGGGVVAATSPDLTARP